MALASGLGAGGDPIARIANLPCWKGKVAPVPLVGGITNRNLLVHDGGDRYVVRLGEDIPIHNVMRFNELNASRAAHAAGISPEVIYTEPGVVVLRFIEGRTLTAEDVRSPRYLAAIVDIVRRCHRDVAQHLAGPALAFWPFHVINRYARTLTGARAPTAGLLPELMACMQTLETTAGASSLVFAHNDLLPANILDDGKRLWLIDWDYAGFNSPLFDLGGLVTNAELPAEQSTEVLRAYFGYVDADLLRRFAAMKCVSLLRETLWSMVSEIYSVIEFDYTAYTAENLRRFRHAYAEFQAGQ